MICDIYLSPPLDRSVPTAVILSFINDATANEINISKYLVTDIRNAYVIPDTNDQNYAFTLHTEYTCKICSRNHTSSQKHITHFNTQQTLLLGAQTIGTTIVHNCCHTGCCSSQKSVVLVIRVHLVGAAAGSLVGRAKKILNMRGGVTMQNGKNSQYSRQLQVFITVLYFKILKCSVPEV